MSLAAAKFVLRDGLDTPKVVLRNGQTSAGTLFDMLDDDVTLKLLSILALLGAALEGNEWHQRRRETVGHVLALSSTCVRLRSVLTGTGHDLFKEIVARSLTDVMPAKSLCQAYPCTPYTMQVKAEHRSASQLRALRCTDDQMAFHCAGKCCERARADANRKLRKKEEKQPHHGVILPICESARAMASAANTPVCFVQAHVRKSRDTPSCHVMRRFDGNMLVGERKLNTHDTGYRSSDHSCLNMATSDDGTLLAYTALTESDGDVLQVFVWDTDCSDTSGTGIRIESPLAVQQVPVALWWRQSLDARDVELKIVWSSILVTPIGTIEVFNENGDLEDGDIYKHSYVLTSYQCTRGGGGCKIEVCDADGPFNGRVLAVHHARSDPSGRCIVFARLGLSQAGSEVGKQHVARVHADGLATELRVFDVYSQLVSESRARDFGESSGHGLTSVGISPSGDCIICIMRVAYKVVALVYELVSETEYTQINTVSLTEWLDMRNDRNMIEYDSYALTRFGVKFSACGRFATVFDKRARFAIPFTGYSAAVIDLAKRRTHASLPTPKPIGYCETAYFDEGSDPSFHTKSLRALEWTKDGVWVMGSRGLLLLRTH